MALTEKDLRKYEELLLKKRKELLEEMGLHGEKYANTVKESTGDHSSYSYHMADQGTDNMERELAFMFASKSGRLVYHIDMALKRIKDGTYALPFFGDFPAMPEVERRVTWKLMLGEESIRKSVRDVDDAGNGDGDRATARGGRQGGTDLDHHGGRREAQHHRLR